MSERGARVVDLALLFVGLAVLWITPHGIWGDGAGRFDSLARLLEDGHFASETFSIVGPLFATPLYLLGRALGDPRAMTAFFNVSLFTLALWFLAREFSEWLSPAAWRTTVLLLVFASMFPNHVLAFFGEVFTAVTVTLGILWLARGRSVLGWAAIILGGANTPGALVGVAAIAALEIRRTRRLTPLLPLAILIALILGENVLMRGASFATGYEEDRGARTLMPYSGRPGFSYPLFFGAMGIVFSFGKGLLFFAPGLFAPTAHGTHPRVRAVHASLVVFVVGLVLVYGRWWAWYGGYFWGPRFFVVASVPACLALATHVCSPGTRGAWANALLSGALVLSFWVGVNGLLFDQLGLGICVADDFANEALCHFTPELSPLWHPFLDVSAVVPQGTRSRAIATLAVWLVALTWVGRGVFAALLRDARRGTLAFLRPAA